MSRMQRISLRFLQYRHLTKPETTDNLEAGLQAALADNRLSLNGAVFKIDYSDQQQSMILAEPPFRTTTNVPSTDINGAELEFVWRASDRIEFSGGFGYLDAEITELNTRPDGVPERTSNLAFNTGNPSPTTGSSSPVPTGGIKETFSSMKVVYLRYRCG